MGFEMNRASPLNLCMKKYSNGGFANATAFYGFRNLKKVFGRKIFAEKIRRKLETRHKSFSKERKNLCNRDLHHTFGEVDSQLDLNSSGLECISPSFQNELCRELRA